jgi:hypothetical protein
MRIASLLILLLTFTTQLFSQETIPAEFSWNNVCTTNGLYNYVTPAREQNYHGPCMSFAFNAAIETMYAIENDINDPDLTLSDPYLDYKVWDPDNYVPILNSNVKIPLVTFDGTNTFPPNCENESDCQFREDVLAIIDDESGQKSYKFESVLINSDEGIEVTELQVLDGGYFKNYVTVGNTGLIDNNSISSIDDIKNKILNNGPIVLKVSGIDDKGNHNSRQFRDYNVPTLGLNYHAFTIIGWTEDSRWIIKDSWPGMSGNAVETYKDIDILSLMTGEEPDVVLYQVSGISYNETPSSTNTITFSDNCEPIELSSIDFDIDYEFIGGVMYHKFWVTSNNQVDNWVWGIGYPNGSIKRSQVNNATYSSVLLSPTYDDVVTVYVNAYKNGVIVATKEKNIYLSNGQSGGGGFGVQW